MGFFSLYILYIYQKGDKEFLNGFRIFPPGTLSGILQHIPSKIPSSSPPGIPLNISKKWFLQTGIFSKISPAMIASKDSSKNASDISLRNQSWN